MSSFIFILLYLDKYTISNAKNKIDDIYNNTPFTKEMEYYRKAERFYYGTDGVTQNYIEAMVWFGKSAHLGSSDAMYKIGYMFHQGEGVPQNYALAMEWYQKSDKLNNFHARRQIEIMYNNGTA